MSDPAIQCYRGDITLLAVDAIVNAANTELWLGSGVAGAIRDRGGPSIQEECRALAPIPLGAAVITGAGHLRSRYIIHAAGMEPGGTVTEEALEMATRNALICAAEKRLHVIAFPAIGTGVGRLAPDIAARVMTEQVCNHMVRHDYPAQVIFALRDELTRIAFEAAIHRAVAR